MTSAAACRLLAGRHRPRALTFRDLPAEEQEAGSVRPPRFCPLHLWTFPGSWVWPLGIGMDGGYNPEVQTSDICCYIFPTLLSQRSPSYDVKP